MLLSIFYKPPDLNDKEHKDLPKVVFAEKRSDRLPGFHAKKCTSFSNIPYGKN